MVSLTVALVFGSTAAFSADTDELRKRVEEAEAQLREEAKIIERMTRDSKSKQEQIVSMELMLQREIEKHQASVRMLEDEHVTQKLQAEHEIAVLNRKVSELELHVEAYDVIESANVALRDRVDKLMLQLEQDTKNHAEEIHKVRLDMFNHKMALEKVRCVMALVRIQTLQRILTHPLLLLHTTTTNKCTYDRRSASRSKRWTPTTSRRRSTPCRKRAKCALCHCLLLFACVCLDG